MTKPFAVRIVYALMAGCLLFVMFSATGCTIAKYTAPDGSRVFVADFHPVGGATDIEASSNGTTRTLKATRGQGSAEGLVSGVVDAAAGL